MSEIYYEAGRVVIWLGESDETTTDGISMLQDLERRLNEGRSHELSKFDFEELNFEGGDTWNTESDSSLQEVYIRTAKALIRLTGSVKILSLAEHKSSLDDVALPS
jgi:hypothetical protein